MIREAWETPRFHAFKWNFEDLSFGYGPQDVSKRDHIIVYW